MTADFDKLREIFLAALEPGTWVHMPAGLQHSIKAKTPVVMLLVLLKQREQP